VSSSLASSKIKGYDVERISGHAIDSQHVGERKPIPLRVRFYIDGYGAKITSESLYDIGIERLNEHLDSQFDTDDKAVAIATKNDFYAPKTPEILAEILGYCLGLIELNVISVIEDRLRAIGRPVFPNALLVNRSSPLNISHSDKHINIFEALYPVNEIEFDSNEYLDARCDGIIYRPKKIDREKEIAELRREIKYCELRGDESRISWLRSNIKAIEDGAMLYRSRYTGGPGKRIEFALTERFFDEVSDRIGYYSRLGEYKIHWSKDLNDFGEKGVDCDLIMQVMDDLHNNEVDVFVIMTNDMDFLPLVERIQEDGKSAFLCGMRKNVSSRLVNALSRDSFFDLSEDAILKNLPAIFMTLQKPETRRAALQWAWLALRREAESNSRQF
jgi:uncharacterized LabA/DUF88 family protein